MLPTRFGLSSLRTYPIHRADFFQTGHPIYRVLGVHGAPCEGWVLLPFGASNPPLNSSVKAGRLRGTDTFSIGQQKGSDAAGIGGDVVLLVVDDHSLRRAVKAVFVERLTQQGFVIVEINLRASCDLFLQKREEYFFGVFTAADKVAQLDPAAFLQIPRLGAPDCIAVRAPCEFILIRI